MSAAAATLSPPATAALSAPAASAAPSSHSSTPHSEFPLPHLPSDPAFARFANLEGLLDLAIRAENRLRGHLDPKRIERFDILHTQAVVLSICRLTAVRKTLLEAWKSARSPISPFFSRRNPSAAGDPVQPDPPGASPIRDPQGSAGNPEPPCSAPPSQPPSESRSESHSAPQFSRINAVRSIPACPVIPESRDMNLELAKILSDLDALEKNAMELAGSIAPGGPLSAASLPSPESSDPPELPAPLPPHRATRAPAVSSEASTFGPGLGLPGFGPDVPGISKALAAALSVARIPAPHPPIVHPPPRR